MSSSGRSGESRAIEDNRPYQLCVLCGSALKIFHTPSTSRIPHHAQAATTPKAFQSITVSAPPSQGGVFCSPPLARAHVDCRNYRRQTGYKYISCSQTTGAGAHAREAAVNDAVAAFVSSGNSRPLASLAILDRVLADANLVRSRRARANLEYLDKRTQ